MRQFLTAALCLSALVPGLDAQSSVVLDNAQVRVVRGTHQALAPIVQRVAGVVVPLQDGPARKAGEAYWAADAAAPDSGGDSETALIVIVQPKNSLSLSAPPSALKPGDAPFVGMSFKTLFENALVSVIRARMEVDAREGFHTHGSDTIVVHLSGGEIEDTANGKTTVNRWRRGDVELETRGSSHSARNVGQAVDVVLVALKP